MNEWIKKVATKKRMVWFAVAVVAIGSFFTYRAYAQPSQKTQYVLGTAQSGLFIASLNGTGQVSSESQIDVKPTVSAAIVSIAVKEGQQVKKGDVIAVLDTTDQQKAVRDAGQAVHDAQISYDASNLSLQKIKQPAATADLLAATDALNQAQRDLAKLQQGPTQADLDAANASIQSAQQNVKISSDGVTPQGIRNSYDTMVSTLKSTSPALGYALTDADNVLAVDNVGANSGFVNLLSVLDKGQLMMAVNAYNDAKTSVNNAKALTDVLPLLNADTAKVDAAVAATQDALDTTSKMLGYVSNALMDTLTSSSFTQSSLDSLKSTNQSDRSNMVSKLSSLLSQQQALTQAKTSYASSQIQLQQAQIALEKLTAPPDPKDVQAAQEKVLEAQQKVNDLKAGALPVDLQIAQNSLDARASALTQARIKYSDAAQALNDYTVRSPFDGVIAKLPLIVSDVASPSTAVATLVAQQQMADVTLNEIDAAKVKAGQKVTLTFDAIDGLSIAGTVAEVSTLGTVTQGVVNYDVKLSFDTQDTRVKPGMSVNAAIITDVQPNVVMVPNAAVKNSNNQSYVEVLDNVATSTGTMVTGTPRQVNIQVGSSNDTNTVVTNGLSDGQQVVIQTIAPSTAKTTASANSTNVLRSLTGGGGGAGAFRATGGGAARGN